MTIGTTSDGTGIDHQDPEWDGVCHRAIDVTIKGVNEEARSVDVVASSTAIDSHGDILEQDWKLARFRKNPVVLWHHNIFESSRWSMGEGIRPEDLLPIGHATKARVEDGKLQATLNFGSAEFNPMSEKVFLGFKEGHIRAVSVGFRPGKITEETVDGGTLFRLSENELMEISAVPIPSNPEAVSKSAAFERQHFGRLAANDGGHPAEESDTMNAEEKKALEDAQARATIAERDQKTAGERAEKAETSLKAEKAISGRLTTELDTASKRADDAEGVVTEQKIDALVGKKITPAERDEFVTLAKDVGIERVEKILDKRPKLGITEPVLVDGQPITGNPAPPPVEPGGGNASADIAKAATDAANRVTH